MENITPYNEFLNENQMRIPFLDLEVAKKETKAHIKPFLEYGIYNDTHLEFFLSLDPTKAEINDVIKKTENGISDAEYLLELHGEGKVSSLTPEQLKNLAKVIKAGKISIEKLKRQS
jgi:hypothetical protein